MRHSCIFAAVPLLALALAGCGPDSSGDSAFNPAADVDLSFSTFVVEDQEGLPSRLQHTAFWDFYRGIEPTDGEGEQAEAVAEQLRRHLDPFLGATPTEDGTRYTSVRNPVDLLNDVIGRNLVDNFNEGRRLMYDSITEDEAARYNTPANNALIRFTETGDNSEEGVVPSSDRTWVYTMLDWTSNPSLGKVFRAAQFVARAPADNDESIAELKSALWSGRFDAQTFSVSGFNQPEYAAISLTGRTRGNVELRQEFVGTDKDTLSLTQVNSITIGGEKPDCIRAVLNYEEAILRVFTSSGESPSIVNEETEKTEPNPDHCGNQQNGKEAQKYRTEAVTTRQ